MTPAIIAAAAAIAYIVGRDSPKSTMILERDSRRITSILRVLVTGGGPPIPGEVLPPGDGPGPGRPDSEGHSERAVNAGGAAAPLAAGIMIAAQAVTNPPTSSANRPLIIPN